MKTKRIVFAVVSGTLMLAVMITIFIFSNQNGEASTAASSSAGSFILQLLHIEVPPGQSPSSVPIIFGFTIRNLAHIFLYTCLGLASYLFCLSGLAIAEIAGHGLKGKARLYRAPIAAGAAVGISLIYAVSDEFHQMFVGGRSATIRDVGIDAIGFLLAIGLALGITLLIEWALRRRKSKKM